MMLPRTPLLALLLLAACHKPAPDPSATADAKALTNLPLPAPVPLNVAAETPSEPQDTDDPQAFRPLASQAVKDAIHRALDTAATQRWEDGKLSGYAVPSSTADAHGCRAVRYTVDQRPAGAFETINACDASR